MLKHLRKNTKLIIWIVVVSFVLWGGYSIGTSFQKEGRIAGEMFGKNVNFQEFNTFYKASQIFSATGATLQDPEVLKHKTWQSILFVREAKKRGIEVTDDEVRSEVERLLAAQKIENPTPEFYRNWLSTTLHETPAEFEKQIRELLRIQKLVKEVNASFQETATEEEAERLFTLESKKISVEVTEFSAEEEAKSFVEEARKPGSKEAEQISRVASRKIENTDLLALIQSLQISEAEAEKLHALAKESISDPVAAGRGWAVFKILDKQESDPKKFDEEKEKYKAMVVERKTYGKFLEWTLDLMNQAEFKDFLLRETAAP